MYRVKLCTTVQYSACMNCISGFLSLYILLHFIARMHMHLSTHFSNMSIILRVLLSLEQTIERMHMPCTCVLYAIVGVAQVGLDGIWSSYELLPSLQWRLTKRLHSIFYNVLFSLLLQLQLILHKCVWCYEQFNVKLNISNYSSWCVSLAIVLFVFILFVLLLREENPHDDFYVAYWCVVVFVYCLTDTCMFVWNE